jgi:methyl-accepting chemotaxis protein
MDNVKNRRRNYYINKEFQTIFILKFCGLIAIGSVISGLIVYAMSRTTVTTIFENSRLTIKSTADFILPAVLLSGAVVIVLVGLATIMMTLFISHKIAGPLYRLDKDVQEITEGNLRVTFRLRTGDELKPLVGSMNDMTNALRTRIAEAKNGVEELESSSNLPSEAMEKVRKLKKSLERFIT